MYKKLWIAMIGFGLVGASSHTFGAFDQTLFPETFSTDSASIFTMNNTDYTNYLTRAAAAVTPTGTANVSGGKVVFNNSSNFETDTLSLSTISLNSSTSEKFSVSVDVAGGGVSSAHFVGLVAGNRALGFWPGYTDHNNNHSMFAYNPGSGLMGSGIGSSFGPGSGGAITGTNHVEISWNPSLTTWTYRFTKVNGGGASYTNTIVDPTFVMGEVGVFSTLFNAAQKSANFDNLMFIPEPSSMAMIGLSAVVWLRRRGVR